MNQIMTPQTNEMMTPQIGSPQMNQMANQNTFQIIGPANSAPAFLPMNNYEASFLNLPDKTIYHNPCGWDVHGEGVELYGPRTNVVDVGKMHLRNNMALKAFQTTSGTYTPVGSPLIATFPDFLIYDKSRKRTPMSVITTRVTNRGDYASYVTINSKGAAFAAAEGATLMFPDDTYARSSTRIKLLYAARQVSGFMLAASQGYNLAQFTAGDGYQGGFSSVMVNNAKEQATALATRSLMELLESQIVAGDVATTAAGFNGIVKLMGTTNTINKSSTDFTLDDIHEAAQMAYDNSGNPSVILCSSACFTRLQKLLGDQVRWLNPGTDGAIAGFGFSGMVLNSIIGIPMTVIPSQYLSNSANKRSIYLLDMSVIELRVLQDVMYEKKYVFNQDTYPFTVKMYCTLLLRVPEFCASITNIK